MDEAKLAAGGVRMSLHRIYARSPLVHCITNTVVTNFTANGLLAVGASPMMAEAAEEMVDIARIADALLVNIGTLQPSIVHVMELAIREAAKHDIPIVLDPVGAGASTYRYDTTMQLLQTGHVTLLRCNAGELAAISGVVWHAKGVDSGEGDANIACVAKEVAKQYDCVVVVTGATDIVTDGEKLVQVNGGNARITKITGTGCLLSALCAAVLAVEHSVDVVAALLHDYKEAAVKAAAPIGTYQVQLLNELERLAEVAR